MEHVRLRVIAEDVQRSRKQLGLETEQLAGKAGVSSRFLRNLGKDQGFTKQLRYLTMLLSLLMFLKLYQHGEDVRAVMQGMTQVGRKTRRKKIDRRQFGRVHSRRGQR